MFSSLRSHRLKLKSGKTTVSPVTGGDLSGVSSIGSSFLSTNMNQLDEASKETVKITPISPLKKRSKNSMNQQLNTLQNFEKIKDIEQFLKLEDELLNSVDALPINFLKKKLISNLIISLFKFFKSNIDDGYHGQKRLIDLDNKELYNDIQNVVNNLISVISSMTSVSIEQQQNENKKPKEIIDDEFEDSEHELVPIASTIRSFSRLLNNNNNSSSLTPRSRSRSLYYNTNNNSGLTTPFRTFTPALQQNYSQPHSSMGTSMNNNFSPFAQHQHQHQHSQSLTQTDPNSGSIRFDLQPPPTMLGPPLQQQQQQQQQHYQQISSIPQSGYTTSAIGTPNYPHAGLRYNNNINNTLNPQMMASGASLQQNSNIMMGNPGVMYTGGGQGSLRYSNLNNAVSNPYVDVYYQ